MSGIGAALAEWVIEGRPKSEIGFLGFDRFA
jgi:hypothetical protein